ncbi:MAG TPA: hypothetical protein VNG33_03775, partial [Polyangiaceae bacterium]|nr:hypothetical protein [Polyangiaceae bacterium]
PRIPQDSVCAGAGRPAECQIGLDKFAEYDRLRNYALGAFITSGVFAAATAATFVIWPGASKSTGTSTGRLFVSPIVGRGGSAAIISGRF